MKTDQKYYIGKNDKLTIRCFACKRIRTITVAGLKLKQHFIKVVCPCSHSFFILLEFRQSYRKKLKILGTCRKRSESAEQGISCIVRDISVGGLGISITNDTAIQVKDELIVTFKLGAFQQSDVEAFLQVRHIDSGKNIGGVFTGSITDRQLEAVTLFLR